MLAVGVYGNNIRHVPWYVEFKFKPFRAKQLHMDSP